MGTHKRGDFLKVPCKRSKYTLKVKLRYYPTANTSPDSTMAMLHIQKQQDIHPAGHLCPDFEGWSDPNTEDVKGDNIRDKDLVAQITAETT